MTNGTHTHTQVCDREDVWNQAVHTDREDTANRTDVIIKTTDNVALPVDNNVTQKEAEKRTKMQESTYRDTTNMEHEICYHTGNSWTHRNSNTRFKEKFGTRTV